MLYMCTETVSDCSVMVFSAMSFCNKSLCGVLSYSLPLRILRKEICHATQVNVCLVINVL